MPKQRKIEERKEEKNELEIKQEKKKILKISSENNENVVKIWSHFLSNYNSYLHQYGTLITKLVDISQQVEDFVAKQQEKKQKILDKYKGKSK